MNRIVVTAILIILGFAGSAQATFIDFRSSDFSYAADKTSYEYDGLTIESSPDGTELFWDQDDGLGINTRGISDEGDEVDGDELLHLAFDTPQLLSSILITDLFYEKNISTDTYYYEKGSYRFNNEAWYDFTAVQGSNGLLTLSFSSIAISEIWFKAAGDLGDGINHEFSVGGVDVAPVPEPATMLLLGTGLVGLAGLRRKLKKS